MMRTYAAALALASALIATVASADPPTREDIQAPRGDEQVQAPRSQDVQAPRGQ